MRARRTTTNAVRAGLACLSLLATLLAAGCAGARTDTNMIAVTLDKASEDTATVRVEDGRAVIDVTSPSGIGGLTATLSGGKWPKEVVVRLRLRGLERLEIGYGDVTLTTGLSSSGGPGPALTLSVTAADGTVQSASPSADIYYPDIHLVTDAAGTPVAPWPEGSVVEITLPPHFHQDKHPSFTLRWIDFYR